MVARPRHPPGGDSGRAGQVTHGARAATGTGGQQRPGPGVTGGCAAGPPRGGPAGGLCGGAGGSPAPSARGSGGAGDRGSPRAAGCERADGAWPAAGSRERLKSALRAGSVPSAEMELGLGGDGHQPWLRRAGKPRELPSEAFTCKTRHSLRREGRSRTQQGCQPRTLATVHCKRRRIRGRG